MSRGWALVDLLAHAHWLCRRYRRHVSASWPEVAVVSSWSCRCSSRHSPAAAVDSLTVSKKSRGIGLLSSRAVFFTVGDKGAYRGFLSQSHRVRVWRIAVCDARPIPAAQHHCPLASTKLYCLMTEARMWTTYPGALRTSGVTASRTYWCHVWCPNTLAIVSRVQ